MSISDTFLSAADTEYGFDLRLIKSKRKSIGLYIKSDKLEVRAPYWVRNEEIFSFVSQKQVWVTQQLAEQAKRNNEKPTLNHESHLLFFGETRHIQFHLGAPKVIERNDCLHVFHNKSQHSRYLQKWLRQEAEHYLKQRTLELADKLHPPKAIQGINFRKTKSKWGHCTSQGEIQLNWLLIMAPPEVMDYVIIHELCHLTHMNHSQEYWRLVERFCPAYKSHKAWLSDNGHKISL